MTLMDSSPGHEPDMHQGREGGEGPTTCCCVCNKTSALVVLVFLELDIEWCVCSSCSCMNSLAAVESINVPVFELLVGIRNLSFQENVSGQDKISH